jgi:DNA-binding transcriptional LysR family regulator
VGTFLVVARERSFSNASKKLQISQPAVTQQIKVLEEFLGVKLFERRKSGIVLTPDGERFYQIALRLEEALEQFREELCKFKKRVPPFVIGASFTVGNYHLPSCIPYLQELINREVTLVIKDNDTLFDELRKKRIEVAFTTKKADPSFNYHFWKKDKLVLFSNKPLPPVLKLGELEKYKLICREPYSNTRQFIKEIFSKEGAECDKFNIVAEVHNSTALKNTILNSREQVVSIISRVVIEEEVRQKRLFISRIEGINLERSIYMVYLKPSREIETIKSFFK